MSAPGSRLARQMRPHLGAALWGEFVAHANRHYKARWLRAFAPASGVLRCVGALDGAPCAHGALVDLRAETWDRGAGTGEWGRAEREVGAALCHDLFGVCASAAHGPACVRCFVMVGRVAGERSEVRFEGG